VIKAKNFFPANQGEAREKRKLTEGKLGSKNCRPGASDYTRPTLSDF
jgi:hypothetical protein